jgi:hypothetical protein
MSKSLLITFGCSWTYGIGAGYEEGMNEEFYTDKIRWSEELCYEHSWRRIVLDNLNIKGLNFSVGGSSNQKQFKFAKEFFISDEWNSIKNEYDNIVVLWGLTTTERTYMWCNDVDSYQDIFLHDERRKFNKIISPVGNKFIKKERISFSEQLELVINRLSYNHDNEVEQLTNNILFWNYFFKAIGIKNIWFDTFDSHQYTSDIENLIDSDNQERDLLFKLCSWHIEKNPDILETDKLSKGAIVTHDYFLYAARNKIINPYSYHPVKSQYRLIGEYFTKQLRPYFH